MNTLKRIWPHRVQDLFYLSLLLRRYLDAMAHSPLQVDTARLAHESKIPLPVFERLANLQENPEDAAHITAEDFHIVFKNVLFRYPTVRIWADTHGDIYIEL